MENKIYDTDDFYIRKNAIELDSYIRKYLINSIPSIDRDIRIHLLDEVYYLIKNINYAIANSKNIRIKNITDALINISMIDYLLGYIINIKNINKNHVNKSISKLLNIRNMMKAWKLKEMELANK